LKPMLHEFRRVYELVCIRPATLNGGGAVLASSSAAGGSFRWTRGLIQIETHFQQEALALFGISAVFEPLHEVGKFRIKMIKLPRVQRVVRSRHCYSSGV